MEKKNKQILDDVQKYLKNESEQLKEKKKLKKIKKMILKRSKKPVLNIL